MELNKEFIGLFIQLSGFIIGLGAVTVIDLHGFLARTSNYWTLATIRAHKITKPLIWIGTLLAILGGFIFYIDKGFPDIFILQPILAAILVLNGLFLTFGVSRHLIKKEKEGKSDELLTSDWQIKITISFLISFIGWWTQVLMLVARLSWNI